MLYLSKGMVIKQSTEQMLCVTHCGIDYMLTGVGARLWLDGRFGVKETQDAGQDIHLRKLQQLGLVELSEETGMPASYHLLTRCIICPAKLKSVRKPLSPAENKVWRWIKGAGLRLTIGELTKLFTEGLEPSPDLLGKENAQTLTMRLYASDPIFDTTLEIQMEHSPKRDDTVNAVLGLLRKKRIILI